MENKALYVCQPCLNHSCTKENCYLNGGQCCCTLDKNSAALLYGRQYYPYYEKYPEDVNRAEKDFESGNYSIVHLISEFLKGNFMDINTSRGYFAFDIGHLLGIDPLYLTLDELDRLYYEFGIVCRKTISNKYALLIEKGELK